MPFISNTNVISAFENKITYETPIAFEPGGDFEGGDGVTTESAGDLLGEGGDRGEFGGDFGGRPGGGRPKRPPPTPVAVERRKHRTDFPLNPDFQLQIGDQKQGRMIYVMRDDFYYCHARTNRVFRVRRHFETDLASVPKPVWVIVNPSGVHAPAAIIHDWLYAIGAPGGHEDADGVMLDAVVDLGVPELQRDIIYTAIRSGGAKGYGLASDWVFSDPSLNGKRYEEIPRKLPKRPTSAVCHEGPCGDFQPPGILPNSPYD